MRGAELRGNASTHAPALVLTTRHANRITGEPTGTGEAKIQIYYSRGWLLRNAEPTTQILTSVSRHVAARGQNSAP